MAYITAQEVKQIRQALKKELPQYKFSVRKRDHLSVNVAFLSGAKFESFEGLNWRTDKREIMEIDGNGEGIGTNTEKYGENNKKIFDKVFNIIKYASSNQHYDKSDSMTDYFDVAFYFHLSLGQWDKPYQVR